MLVEFYLFTRIAVSASVWECLMDLSQLTPSPDFFIVWRCQRRSLRFKIFVHSCYNHNYCIFFLKTVSDNVRWIQTISDNIRPYLFKSVGGNVGGILLIYENSSVSRCLVVSHVSISTNTFSGLFLVSGSVSGLLIVSQSMQKLVLVGVFSIFFWKRVSYGVR